MADVPTLVMFPALVAVYCRLAIAEERETRAPFGPDWDVHAARTPRLVPRFRPRGSSAPAET